MPKRSEKNRKIAGRTPAAFWVEPTTREGWLLHREYDLIDEARLLAQFAYQDTGQTPRLHENKKYKAFLACLAAGDDPLAEE